MIISDCSPNNPTPLFPLPNPHPQSALSRTLPLPPSMPNRTPPSRNLAPPPPRCPLPLLPGAATSQNRNPPRLPTPPLPLLVFNPLLPPPLPTPCPFAAANLDPSRRRFV